MKTKIIGKNIIKSIQAQSPELAVLMSEYATRDEVYAAFDKKGNAAFGKIVDLTVCAAGNGTFTIESTNYQPDLSALSKDDIDKYKESEICGKKYDISCYERIERVADTKKLNIDPEEVINKLIELLAKTVDLQTVCRISDKSLQESRLRGNGFLSQCHRVSKADYISFTGDIYDEKDNSSQSYWAQGEEESDRDKMQKLKKNVMLCKIKIASGDTVDTQAIEDELESRYKKYGEARDTIAQTSSYINKILCDIENKKRLYMGVRIKEKELDALSAPTGANEEIRRRCISRLSIIDRCRKCIRKSDITGTRSSLGDKGKVVVLRSLKWRGCGELWPVDKGKVALVERTENFIKTCKSEADKEEVKQEFTRAVGKSKTLMRLFWLSASVIAVIAAAIVNIVALQ